MISPLYALEIPDQKLAKISMCLNSIQTVVRSLFVTKERKSGTLYLLIYEINLFKSSKLDSKTNCLITINNLKLIFLCCTDFVANFKTCVVVFFNDAIHNTIRVAA